MPLVEKEGPLLKFLMSRFPGYKRTKLKQFLKYGSVTVNGIVTTAFDHALRPGDKVDMLDRGSARRQGLKSRLSFTVVHEDEWLIVIDKPAGLLTMGTDREKISTAYYELTTYVRGQAESGRGRIFIVHRLDRDASGLVVFAKRAAIKEALQKSWAEAIKKYYAVVEGSPPERSGTIESFLLEDKFRRVYNAGENAPGAKRSVTRYEVSRSNERYSLLDITLITGRKNQIRVHCADLGHPIVGDKKYGAVTDAGGRLALHAYYLSFRHPGTGRDMAFESPLPGPLKKLMTTPKIQPKIPRKA